MDGESLAPAPGVVYRDLDGGGVLLDVETGAYFSLNTTGVAIWNLLPGSVNDVVEAVVRRYRIEVDDCRSQVTSFLAGLHSRGLIRGIPTEF